MPKKFEDLPIRVQLLLYVKSTLEMNPEAIFCSSEAAFHKAGDELIAEGLLKEIEGPGGADRAWALTDAGKEYMGVE